MNPRTRAGGETDREQLRVRGDVDEDEDEDEDEAALAAYNALLARMNRPEAGDDVRNRRPGWLSDGCSLR